MELIQVINGLRQELAQIERALVELEALAQIRSGKTQDTGLDGAFRRFASRRGRKSMGLEERKEVSARMKRYWAGRRKGAGK